MSDSVWYRFQEIFFMFHIVCTFAMQSRAFLSQLSVTGDESGFLCLSTKVVVFVCFIPLVTNIFHIPMILYVLFVTCHCIWIMFSYGCQLSEMPIIHAQTYLYHQWHLQFCHGYKDYLFVE